MQVRARRHVLPQQVAIPSAGFWSSLEKGKGKDGVTPTHPRIWNDESPASLSAASTPQGTTPPGKARDPDPANRPSECNKTLKTFRWSLSNEEFKLVDGFATDPRSLVPVLDGE